MSFGRRFVSYALVTLPWILLGTHINGCSLLGLGVGHLVDVGGKDTRPVGVFRIRPGARVSLQLRDGTTVTGTLEAVDRQLTPGYEERFQVWASTGSEPPLPGPADTVHIVLRDPSGTGKGRTLEGRLVAYDVDQLMIAGAGMPTTVDVNGASEIRARGRVLRAAQLRSEMRAAAVPLISEVVLVTPAGPRRIPVDQVVLVNGPTPAGGKIAGFLVGLAADAVIITAASSYEPSGCGNY